MIIYAELVASILLIKNSQMTAIIVILWVNLHSGLGWNHNNFVITLILWSSKNFLFTPSESIR